MTPRRLPVLAGVGLAVVLSVVLAVLLTVDGHAAQNAGQTRVYRYLMGTSVEVEAFGGQADVRRAAIEEAFGAIAEVDRLMSNYREDSELSRINREAALHAVPVSDPMFDVLTAAQRISTRSEGAFDVTVGPLVRLWGFHDRIAHVPNATELAAVRSLVGFRNLIVDPRSRSVRFSRAGVELDLGGIAKGFAVELAADVLRRRGLAGFIDAGGNQYLLGAPAGKQAWTVGVKDPDAPERLLGVIESPEGSVSTSADYANFLVADNGHKYGHVLDPRTLRPSDAALSVTILSRDGTLADAMSKAAFVLGPQAGLDLIDTFPGMSGVIAYRRTDGGIGVAVSERLRARFTPSSR